MLVEASRELAGEFLRLESLASAPYTQFVFGDVELARQAHQQLFAAGSAEFAPPFGRAALLDGHLVGMVAALSGADLQRRRLQSSLTLARWLRNSTDVDGLRERLQLAATTLLKVARDEFYLSRIAVGAAARGLGIGHTLLDHVEQAARDQGARRLVLEVSPVHPTAVRLYRGAGFHQVDARSVSCSRTGQTLTYLHFEKRLDGSGRTAAEAITDVST